MPGPKKPKIDPATDTCVQKPLMLLNSKVMSCNSIQVMLNRKGLGVRKIAQTLSEHEMATILAWHGDSSTPGNVSRLYLN
jgi:hypothetical protein